MIHPMQLPAGGFDDGEVSLREYRSADAPHLFEALRDERAWEHVPRAIPRDATELDASISANSAGGHRITFTVRRAGTVVGRTSMIWEPSDPDGIEIGATQFDPTVWGCGVNTRAKRMLIGAAFAQGAAWIRFRTDERNGRSAAAIRKLGATDLGVRQDDLVRRDGSRRRSRFFRLDRPEE